jgi:hypothetical protein
MSGPGRHPAAHLIVRISGSPAIASARLPRPVLCSGGDDPLEWMGSQSRWITSGWMVVGGYRLPCVINRCSPPTFNPQNFPKTVTGSRSLTNNLLKSLALPRGLEPAVRGRLRRCSIVLAALTPACPRPRVWPAQASVHRGRGIKQRIAPDGDPHQARALAPRVPAFAAEDPPQRRSAGARSCAAPQAGAMPRCRASPRPRPRARASGRASRATEGCPSKAWRRATGARPRARRPSRPSGSPARRAVR